MPVGPRLHRRSALAAGLAGALVLGWCDSGDLDPLPSPTTTPDPDAALVDEVVADLVRAERVATAGGALELAALHRAHLAALDSAPPTTEPRREVDADVVRRQEQRLHARLVDAAMAAESGSLASLLASMSAAVAQRLVVGEVAP